MSWNQKRALLASALAIGAAAVYFSGVLDMPENIVLDAECQRPPRYAFFTFLDEHRFWATQLVAIKAERQRLESWPQTKATLKASLDELSKKYEPTAPAKTFAENCPELSARASRRYNIPLEDCPPVSAEQVRQNKAQFEADKIRRDAERKAQAVLDAESEPRMEVWRLQSIAWLKSCETSVINKPRYSQ